ncbi:Hsp20/alpha crystallin family protein [Natronorubrum sp. DTA28]|uniref:Hsp20/alpha crystallin family protein n=1 Tax=Natronorubrum sp. DTA28 TaxID=3447019 RepID=UPI003F848FA7
MTEEDTDPDDRRDESSDEYDEAVNDANSADEGADAIDDDDSTDVPIDDSPSSDESPSDEPTADQKPSDRRLDDRESDESEIGVSVSGTDASPESDDHEANDEGTHWLSSLLSALESLDSGSTSGRRRTDRTVLDYDISVRSGDDVIDESRFERTSFTGEETNDRHRRSDSDTDRPRKRRRRSASSEGHLTTRRHDDELLVTADVAGTDPDDVTVGFDDSTLVVALSGSELDRVDVPWPDRTSEATIKNGVLTVLIEPATDEAASTETEGGDGDE